MSSQVNANTETAIIVGAGPAGLTAAFEMLTRSKIRPIIYEMSGDIGGISKTVKYRGNRIDIGGHRFFSKSDRVMDWWRGIMPFEAPSDASGQPITVAYQNQTRTIASSGVQVSREVSSDLVMLVRRRLSRILYLRKFFDYPLALNLKTLQNLGLRRLFRVGLSYAAARIAPIKKERSLEDFFINRFGRELYQTFFRDYTEKVWGVRCSEISPEWGAQRIKGLSITKAVVHAAKAMLPSRIETQISQKNVETSLIERFLYPKFGPGQLWEEVARLVVEMGGEIHLHSKCVGVTTDNQSIESLTIADTRTGEEKVVKGDIFFSTMAVQDLVAAMDQTKVPSSVCEVAAGLVYRDFITVGLLVSGMAVGDETPTGSRMTPDTWIYIQEPDVKIGRLQVFNNWSPAMVSNPEHVWLGLEYFCNKGDPIWEMPDAELKDFAIAELDKIGLVRRESVLDATVLRMEKTYPAYFGTFERFDVVRRFVDKFENLYLVGRNGMHRYNNSDHSMLTAMTAVDNILSGIRDKSNIWAVNTEEDYQEVKSETPVATVRPSPLRSMVPAQVNEHI